MFDVSRTQVLLIIRLKYAPKEVDRLIQRVHCVFRI